MSKVCSFCGNTNFKVRKVQYIYKHTFDVELKKVGKNGVMRDVYLRSEKTNAYSRLFPHIILHQRYKHNNQFLIVNDVPCEECEYCGEQYFEASVLKKIEKDFMEIYLAGKKSKQLIEVPVEEFAEL